MYKSVTLLVPGIGFCVFDITPAQTFLAFYDAALEGQRGNHSIKPWSVEWKWEWLEDTYTEHVGECKYWTRVSRCTQYRTWIRITNKNVFYVIPDLFLTSSNILPQSYWHFEIILLLWFHFHGSVKSIILENGEANSIITGCILHQF